ncbi:MAG: hypothetical protein IKL31_08890 [Ruminococcus sp.]|nr:hypothetical protein [Ruminococcus sp.]MBQ8301128.1 hypothetical protein [Clostridia bacterium]MBR3917728.1 hypothetical protein [Clostridia bacterium]MBR6670838.1 hypothetical protein [Ruminococcus sp.]
MGSSRKKSELKDKVTSIRLTEEQHNTVKANAEAKGMTVSNYIITSVVNGGNELTPQTLIKLQDLTNKVCATVIEYSPESVDAIQKGMNEIWQELKL